MKRELVQFGKPATGGDFILTKNLNLVKHLNRMVRLGFLPITWIEESGPELRFKLSLKKSVLIGLVDVVITTVIVAHMFVWHLVYVGPDFDLSLIFKPIYYMRVFHGSATSAMTELGFIFMPIVFCWIFVKIGSLSNLLILVLISGPVSFLE